MRLPISTALMLAALAPAAQAQVVQGVTQTNPSGTTTTTFTITPVAGVSATDYVKLSADALSYQIAAATLAGTRSQRDDVRAYARQVLDHANTQSRTLTAALTNADRRITRPSSTPSSAKKANIDLLRKAPRGGFDNIFLTQQLDAAPGIWALQKGYASDGTDQALRQVATSAVSTIEQDYAAARALTPAGIEQTR